MIEWTTWTLDYLNGLDDEEYLRLLFGFLHIHARAGGAPAPAHRRPKIVKADQFHWP